MAGMMLEYLPPDPGPTCSMVFMSSPSLVMLCHMLPVLDLTETRIPTVDGDDTDFKIYSFNTFYKPMLEVFPVTPYQLQDSS